MHVRSLVGTAALAAAVLAALPSADARIWPKYSISAAYEVLVPPGFRSVQDRFTFTGPFSGDLLDLEYDGRGGLVAGAQLSTPAGPTVTGFVGSYAVDVDGRQHVHLAQPVGKRQTPGFTFDGVLNDDGGDIVGTYVRQDGYLGMSGSESGDLTFTRNDAAKGASDFVLDMSTVMDDHGRISGLRTGSPLVETRATFTVYGVHFLNGFELPGKPLGGGKVRGRVRTDRFGATTAKITVVARDWRMKLAGPVDDAGFHALVDAKGGGFVVKAVPVLLPVQPGPTPPPPPPPPPPKNQLTGATATIVDGQLTITHSSVPSRFFGAVAGLTITFPTSDGISIVHADPSDASTTPPRRCIVTVGGKTYGTATAPADVALDIRKLTSTSGQTIEVLATGKVYTPGGASKTVNVLVEAALQ